MVVAKEIKAGDTLVSFNYDTVIERIVRKLPNKTLRHGKDIKPETIRFAKPHGSASWSIPDLGYRVTDGEPIWDSVPEAEVKREGKDRKDPLLLGAVPLKSELIYEVQAYYRTPRVFEVIREQWLTLANAMAAAERIVVLGYSFPNEDLYGRFFFRESMRMRSPDLPLHVDFYNLASDSQAIRDVFPSANAICFKGPVTAAEIETPD